MYCNEKKCGDKNCKLRKIHGIHKCAIRKSLHVLGGKRPIPIMVCLQHPKRFGVLKREVEDISEKMLIQTLRQLEKHKFVKRKDFKTIPPKVEYSLTKKGKESMDLVPLLVRIGNTIK